MERCATPLPEPRLAALPDVGSPCVTRVGMNQTVHPTPIRCIKLPRLLLDAVACPCPCFDSVVLSLVLSFL
jgi:hypothetical protein